MRLLLGVLSLLLVVAAIGFLAKKQLSSVGDIKLPQTATPDAPDAPATGAAAAVSASGTVQQRSMQIQQQIKAAAEAALQQPRPMADDK